MIKSLHIRNYLSLRDVEFRLGLRNVLVGPNMSGKSNLIDAYRFLTSIAIFGLNQTVAQRNGFPELLWKGGDAKSISFALNLEAPSHNGVQKKLYHYELELIEGSSQQALVQREKLSVTKHNKTTKLVDLKNGLGFVGHPNGTPIVSEGLNPATSALELNIPGWEGTEARAWLSSWRFYRLIPPLMKQPQTPVAQAYLNEHGDNFSSWMMTLKNSYPEQFALLEKTAQDVLPDLQSVLTMPTQMATTAVTSREKALKKPIHLSRMSDGEIVFLALLSLIFAPDELSAPLACVEEPENHLHPKLLQTLIEVLTQRQTELRDRAAQVVITTHSPHLIDRFSLDELIVVEKKAGETVLTYPGTKTRLKKLLAREDLGLGDLWYSGALGGR